MVTGYFTDLRIDQGGTISNAYGLYSNISNNNAASIIANAYSLYLTKNRIRHDYQQLGHLPERDSQQLPGGRARHRDDGSASET